MFLSLSILLAIAQVHAQSTLTVSVPLTAPTQAVSVSPGLLSLSIEGDRFPDWVANGPSYTTRNQFTFNALSNLGALTGLPPNIRVGANSEDRIQFDASVTIESAQFPPPTSSLPYPEASAVTVADGYYALSRFLPSGTHMTWGLNFGTTNTTAAISEAKSILKTFSSTGASSAAGISLDLLELGNEPDLYGNNGHRASGYSISQYVSEWNTAMSAIISATGLSIGVRPFILGLSFGHSDHGAGGFSPQQAFADGLLTTNAGKFVTIISQHNYEGGCCTALVSDLMSKSLTRSNLTAFSSDISAVKAKGLKYIFGETNSYFNHGVPLVSDAGGSAVWVVDYTLFAGTIGIANMFFHEGIGFKYNLIQPISLNRSIEDATPLNPAVAAHIQPAYYAAIVIAEFLGSSTRNLVELSTTSSSTISAYALYTSTGLARVLLINHQAFLSSSSGARPTVNVFLSLSGGGKTVQIKRLSIPFADSLSGLTWGGQTYETSNALVSGNLVTTSQVLTNPIVVSATEVVMVSF